MTALEIGIASFPVLMGLIFLRVPIGLAMFLAGFVGLVLVTGDTQIPLARLKSETFTTFSSYSLSIVPMFLLMGHFATLGGMSTALFKAAESFLGHRRGGVDAPTVGHDRAAATSRAKQQGEPEADWAERSGHEGKQNDERGTNGFHHSRAERPNLRRADRPYGRGTAVTPGTAVYRSFA